MIETESILNKDALTKFVGNGRAVLEAGRAPKLRGNVDSVQVDPEGNITIELSGVQFNAQNAGSQDWQNRKGILYLGQLEMELSEGRTTIKCSTDIVRRWQTKDFGNTLIAEFKQDGVVLSLKEEKVSTVPE